MALPALRNLPMPVMQDMVAAVSIVCMMRTFAVVKVLLAGCVKFSQIA
jgi:hypothetical protein